MSNLNVQNDKFIPIALPEICAPRHELQNLFHKSANKRIVYISAPAGYGKTVSTLLWLNETSHKTIWMGLDEYDNTTVLFYKLFCAALYAVLPQNECLAMAVKNPAFSASPVEHTLSALSELTLDDNSKYALVMDDLHLITNDEILKSLTFVLKRLPVAITVFLLSRHTLPAVFSTLESQGKISFIGAEQLVFNSDEIQKYFISCGQFITADEADIALSVTNGWAIAIKALAMSGSITLGEKTKGNLFEKYIKTQIWDKWDDNLRTFLLKTSIVDELTPQLCQRLTGFADSTQILEKLCNSNTFIIQTGEHFRYHHLFLEFLRDILLTQQEIEVITLYKIAAEYYLEKGEHIAARHFSVRSGDLSIMTASVYSNSKYNQQNVSVAEYVNASKPLYDEALPEAIFKQNPVFNIMPAWFYFLTGEATKMEIYLDRIYENFAVVAQNYPQFLETMILVCSLDHRQSFAKQIEQFSTFPAIEHESGVQQAMTITIQLPYMHRSIRDYYELANEEAYRRLPATFGALLKDSCDLVIDCVGAGLFYEKNMLNEAYAYVISSQSKITETTSVEFQFSVMVQLATVLQGMGKTVESATIQANIKQFIEDKNALYLRPNFLAYETKSKLSNGDKMAAKTWLDNYFVFESEQLELYKIFQYFTTARAYLVLGEIDRAFSISEKLLNLGMDFNRPLDTAEATVLLVILKWAAGKKQDAVNMLENALVRMQEFGFIRVFADEGKAILPILKRLLLRMEKSNYQGNLNYKYLKEVYMAAYEYGRWCKGITSTLTIKPVNLSKQQKHMLTLLAQGYKNSEIIKMTGLSIHTVRAHSSLAYAKLDVNNAMDAVIKARELGLIE